MLVPVVDATACAADLWPPRCQALDSVTRRARRAFTDAQIASYARDVAELALRSRTVEKPGLVAASPLLQRGAQLTRLVTCHARSMTGGYDNDSLRVARARPRSTRLAALEG
jgi:hypothetical protein